MFFCAQNMGISRSAERGNVLRRPRRGGQKEGTPQPGVLPLATSSSPLFLPESDGTAQPFLLPVVSASKKRRVSGHVNAATRAIRQIAHSMPLVGYRTAARIGCHSGPRFFLEALKSGGGTRSVPVAGVGIKGETGVQRGWKPRRGCPSFLPPRRAGAPPCNKPVTFPSPVSQMLHFPACYCRRGGETI